MLLARGSLSSGGHAREALLEVRAARLEVPPRLARPPPHRRRPHPVPPDARPRAEPVKARERVDEQPLERVERRLAALRELQALSVLRAGEELLEGSVELAKSVRGPDARDAKGGAGGAAGGEPGGLLGGGGRGGAEAALPAGGRGAGGVRRPASQHPRFSWAKLPSSQRAWRL